VRGSARSEPGAPSKPCGRAEHEAKGVELGSRVKGSGADGQQQLKLVILGPDRGQANAVRAAEVTQVETREALAEDIAHFVQELPVEPDRDRPAVLETQRRRAA